MKAVVIHAPHDLRIDEVADVAPGPGEVRVRIGAGGICGSDLHYYHNGGFGTTRIKEPLVLGHEIAGTIVAVGSGVIDTQVGQVVAVNPSRPCGQCSYCHEGRHNLCLDMRFFGSAMRFPHVQGGFREFVTCPAEQAVPVPDGATAGEAAVAEPLAVCLHAVSQAGPLLGREVLVTGAGPIGVLTAAAAAFAGARSVTITDILDAPLRIAKAMGAHSAVNVVSEPGALKPESFDVMFEAAGSARTVEEGLTLVRRGGTIIQIGQGAQASLAMSQLVTREITLRGVFRFDAEFQLAVDLIARRQIDVRPLLTHSFGVYEARQAFDMASDKAQSMKVQLLFGG